MDIIRGIDKILNYLGKVNRKDDWDHVISTYFLINNKLNNASIANKPNNNNNSNARSNLLYSSATHDESDKNKRKDSMDERSLNVNILVVTIEDALITLEKGNNLTIQLAQNKTQIFPDATILIKMMYHLKLSHKRKIYILWY